MFNYIKYADMLKQIIEKKKSVKQVVYNRKKQKFNNQNLKTENLSKISVIYSLLSLTTNNFAKFKEFINKIEAKTHQNVKNPYLLIVMLGEYLNVGKIKGGGKLKRIIMDNFHLCPEIQKLSKINKSNVQIRLIENTIIQQSSLQHSKRLLNFSEKQDIESFIKWTQIFRNIKKFKANEIVKNVYDLRSDQYRQILKQYPILLRSRFAVIQSFSSSIPAFLLLHGVQRSNLGDFKVLDACSAPGNKTIQLGQYIAHSEYNRQVLAFEKNFNRFNILNQTVKRYNSHQNIRTFHENFLATNPIHQKFRNVKFVLLDPSCSGSGMLSNFLRDLNQDLSDLNSMNFKDFCQNQYENLSEQQKSRIEKLHDFQTQLLNHSAKFQPKRISYSTCSIYQRENEDVVEQFLKQHPQYELKQNKVMSKNLGKYSICEGFGIYKHCVRIDPRKRQTDGFFVAIFMKKTFK